MEHGADSCFRAGVGGASWPGAGVDVETGVLFVPSLTLPIVIALSKGDPGGTNPDYIRVGPVYPPGPRGLPLVKPPWGRITAIDLNTGNHSWMNPLGGAPRDVRDHPDLQGPRAGLLEHGPERARGRPRHETLLFSGEGGGAGRGSIPLREPEGRSFEGMTSARAR